MLDCLSDEETIMANKSNKEHGDMPLTKKKLKRSHVACVAFLFCFDLTDHNEQLFRITLKILFLIGVIEWPGNLV